MDTCLVVRSVGQVSSFLKNSYKFKERKHCYKFFLIINVMSRNIKILNILMIFFIIIKVSNLCNLVYILIEKNLMNFFF
jgi:hypothetical protein